MTEIGIAEVSEGRERQKALIAKLLDAMPDDADLADVVKVLAVLFVAIAKKIGVSFETAIEAVRLVWETQP